MSSQELFTASITLILNGLAQARSRPRIRTLCVTFANTPYPDMPGGIGRRDERS
jgi:hypothetical protein